jgi:O-glycosyl hydrolase
MQDYPNIEYWMSEYTLLENNSEIKGSGRDLGMDPALYMARVIHVDLAIANASAWQWWLAVSPYDYKDGLVYIDYNKNDGNIYDSKMLWALGNYSRFIIPGMVRIGVKRSDQRTIEQTLGGVMVSSYIETDSGKTVSVAINYGKSSIPIKIDNEKGFINCTMYRTAGGMDNLRKIGITNFEEAVSLPPQSITTFVEN